MPKYASPQKRSTAFQLTSFSNEGTPAQHRKGIVTDDLPSGWVHIRHPETKELDVGGEECHLGRHGYSDWTMKKDDWELMHDSTAARPWYKRVYMAADAAFYQGYRRSKEAVAKVVEVGGNAMSAVSGADEEKEQGDGIGQEGEKSKKE
jgi:hypothetical protein